ncbi:MAG: DNA adenine methylase [Cyanobium sp. MAG06]|nr:DNA adenine methylase [Cyanobium sp. MAG06]
MKTLINKNEEINLNDLFINQMFGENSIDLSHDYFTNHLITYLGNKRSLLPFLNKYILAIKKKINKDKLISLDGFAGSGVVSRLLLNYSDYLVSNDIENYAYIINKSYLTSKHKINNLELSNYINYINENIDNKQDIDYFIHTNYSPKDDNKIKDGERVFYTSKNGKRIDNAKYLIYNTNIPKKYQDILMSLLLIKASINNNTSGVFKGFHKKNGIGHFGGKGENALSRIKREIILDYPILINHNCDVEVTKNDINELVKNKDIIFDIAYFDPPYNQHPYGSNYFMLNLIAGKEKMEIQDDGVSGIIKD